jgi:hypothetical protein
MRSEDIPREQARMVRMMEQPGPKKKLPSDTSVRIIQKCNGSKWRSASEFAARAGVSEEDVARVIPNIQGSHQHRAKVETKRVGKKRQYRIFAKDKTVSLAELTEKLMPIVEELQIEGKKNMATMVPAKVAILAEKIRRLLDELAE